ncbi:SusD/RagB family nutrient-binding outer membrane lipoprotein [Zhouia spongiae]|uniref:SusD/RagB family nutrient-binding outer membrane lipoprotein n=1 Tax=Zhouia spongiae TaxID=2202721 RepID=A0ABY3YRL1_9FLAO|nr:SusD/RagB family nutrient-binding outer membrane lipoprotein [Zhouia spongiae]UNZ00400.1 SusD/RagB family nutrient-binding outer membrane lipoprotein [Zhouia spongiae]
MKKILNKYIALLLIALVTVSCSSDLDKYALNPNDPETVTPDLLLTVMEVGTFSVYTGNHTRISSLFTQHIAGTSEGQFGQYSNYNITEQTIENEWGTTYENTISPGTVIITDFAEGYDYYNGIAKILLAFNFGVATDLWGDIPFSEASKILSGISNPNYDSQENVIAGIQTLLDEGIGLLSNPNAVNTIVPGADDLIFEGDTDKWISIAYLLKARYALRASLRDASGYDDALGYLASANLTSYADDMNAVFPNSGGNSKNQWKDFEDNRANYIKMGGFFIDLMKDISDPRLPFFASKDQSGDYSGNAVGDINTTSTSKVGPAISSNTVPIGLATYVEAKFIEAEIYMRKNMETEAKAALEEALEASIDKMEVLKSYFEGSDANIPSITTLEKETFITAQTAGTITLEDIMNHKYIALFSSIEPYNDYRRTGFPALTVNPNAANNISVIPVRFPTASTERLYNDNAIVEDDITIPVWWDVN